MTDHRAEAEERPRHDEGRCTYCFHGPDDHEDSTGCGYGWCRTCHAEREARNRANPQPCICPPGLVGLDLACPYHGISGADLFHHSPHCNPRCNPTDGHYLEADQPQPDTRCDVTIGAGDYQCLNHFGHDGPHQWPVTDDGATS